MLLKAEKNMPENSFSVGDWCISSYSRIDKHSMALTRNLKLTAKYYGACQAEQRAAIHSFFHVTVQAIH